MPRFLLTFGLLALLSIPAFAGGKFTITQATGGEHVVIKWEATDESGVQGYQVLRRRVNENREAALPIAVIPLDATRRYTFEDHTLLRTTGNDYIYTIKAVGTEEESDVLVRSEISGVRRTWGSIKAMFR